jgi:hypothetical protein
MNQFFLQQGQSKELHVFPHVLEFALKKNTTTQLHSLHPVSTEYLRVYAVLEGKFEWIIGKNKFNLYPGDIAIILPGQVFGGENGVLQIGTLTWLNLKVESVNSSGMLFGKWSSLTHNENATISKILWFNSLGIVIKIKDLATLFQNIKNELTFQEIGYATRVNHLIDELFICIARQVTQQNN